MKYSDYIPTTSVTSLFANCHSSNAFSGALIYCRCHPSTTQVDLLALKLILADCTCNWQRFNRFFADPNHACSRDHRYTESRFSFSGAERVIENAVSILEHSINFWNQQQQLLFIRLLAEWSSLWKTDVSSARLTDLITLRASAASSRISLFNTIPKSIATGHRNE